MIGKNNHSGFTLIEILVVSAVFSLLFLVGTTVFVNIQSYQRGILAGQRVTADGRYVLEAIARSVRLGTIDYSYYQNAFPGQPDLLLSPQTKLATRDQLNDPTCYWLNGNQLMVGTDCTSGESMTPDDLLIESFAVRISPASNPYAPLPTSNGDCRAPSGPGLGYQSADGTCQCSTNNDCFADQRCIVSGTVSICQNASIQPTVTIVIKTRSTNTAPGERADIRLETTVTSHIYGQ